MPFLDRIAKPGTILRVIFRNFRRSPLSALFVFAYTIWLTKVATGKWFPVRFVYSGRFIPVVIRKHGTGRIVIEDKIVLESWGCGNSAITFNIGQNSVVKFENEFVIGQGTLITAVNGATIDIKGRLNSSGSGITCETRIMAEKSIKIGYDCIIAWGVCITDSNWHELSSRERSAPVHIGDQVWIGHDVSILQGADIGDGCVVGAKSLVVGKKFQPCSLLAGNPARVVRENVSWSR